MKACIELDIQSFGVGKKFLSDIWMIGRKEINIEELMKNKEKVCI
jgi:hypothetical protein